MLIDEYDTPIHAGYFHGYYEEITNFFRNVLSAGLKDNSYLEKSVLTGILRVAKESIFSGLNNLSVFSLIDTEFGDKFGFTEKDVQQALNDYGLTGQAGLVKDWYNGYRFGDSIIYNPWSILNFIQRKKVSPYWVNTSSNDLIKELIMQAPQAVKQDIERLMRGEKITKVLSDSVVFKELGAAPGAVWNFLVFSGYLKAEYKNRDEVYAYHDLSIPNLEVGYLYTTMIRNWIDTKFENNTLDVLLQALLSGNVEEFEIYFQDFVITMLSYHDVGGKDPEKVYQAFVLGLLAHLQNDYAIKSNRESGYGRYDVMIIPKDTTQLGIIIEFKKIVTFKQETKDIALDLALKQIEERKYAHDLQTRGISHILKLAIVFDGKRVWVKPGE